VFPVVIPPAAGLDEFSRLDGCGGPEDGYKFSVAPNPDSQDAETCFRAVEGDPFDQPGKGFAILGGNVVHHTFYDDISPLKMLCLHGNGVMIKGRIEDSFKAWSPDRSRCVSTHNYLSLPLYRPEQ